MKTQVCFITNYQPFQKMQDDYPSPDMIEEALLSGYDLETLEL